MFLSFASVDDELELIINADALLKYLLKGQNLLDQDYGCKRSTNLIDG